MRWPWRREDGAGRRDAGRPAGDAASPAGWAFLPPLQRVTGELRLITAPATFPYELPAWRNPSMTGELTHLVSPDAPAGVVDGDGGGVPRTVASGNDLPLRRPTAQRAVVNRSASPPSPAALTTADPRPLPHLHVEPDTTPLPADTAPPADTAAPADTAPPGDLLMITTGSSSPWRRETGDDHEEAPSTASTVDGPPPVGTYSDGAATYVPVPPAPLQRSVGEPSEPPDRTPGPARWSGLVGLGAPLPSVPPTASEHVPIRVPPLVQRATEPGAPTPSPEQPSRHEDPPRTAVPSPPPVLPSAARPSAPVVRAAGALPVVQRAGGAGRVTPPVEGPPDTEESPSAVPVASVPPPDTPDPVAPIGGSAEAVDPDASVPEMPEMPDAVPVTGAAEPGARDGTTAPTGRPSLSLPPPLPSSPPPPPPPPPLVAVPRPAAPTVQTSRAGTAALPAVRQGVPPSPPPQAEDRAVLADRPGKAPAVTSSTPGSPPMPLPVIQRSAADPSTVDTSENRNSAVDEPSGVAPAHPREDAPLLGTREPPSDLPGDTRTGTPVPSTATAGTTASPLVVSRSAGDPAPDVPTTIGQNTTTGPDAHRRSGPGPAAGVTAAPTVLRTVTVPTAPPSPPTAPGTTPITTVAPADHRHPAPTVQREVALLTPADPVRVLTGAPPGGSRGASHAPIGPSHAVAAERRSTVQRLPSAHGLEPGPHAADPAHSARLVLDTAPPPRPSDEPGSATDTVQRQDSPAAAPTPPVAEPTPATPALAHPGPGAEPGSAGAAAAPNPEQLEELARRLVVPLARRLKAEMLLDRERRGLRTDVR